MMGLSFLNQSGLTRGLRNNNPGNLIRTSDAWQGEVPSAESKDDKFEQFYEMQWGLRALLKDLQNKIKGGKNTVQKIISVYAPNTENNTASYINTVCSALGVTASTVLSNNKATVLALAKTIVFVENGDTDALKIAASEYDNAWDLLQSGRGFDISSLKTVCAFCGHIIVIVALFFFTCFTMLF
jgi:hypothetical protein